MSKTSTTSKKISKVDSFSYKWWLLSDSFIKRSLASLGYHIMGMIFVYIIILAVAIIGGLFSFVIIGMFEAF